MFDIASPTFKHPPESYTARVHAAVLTPRTTRDWESFLHKDGKLSQNNAKIAAGMVADLVSGKTIETPNRRDGGDSEEAQTRNAFARELLSSVRSALGVKEDGRSNPGGSG